MFINDLFESRAVVVTENAEELNIGDPVIITGKVEYSGTTGEIVDFGMGKRFVVVNLYNHGKHSFHSSDVSYNEYADGDDEESRMADNDHDYYNQLDDEQYESAVPTNPKQKQGPAGQFRGTDKAPARNKLVGEGPESHYAKDPSGYTRNLHTGGLEGSDTVKPAGRYAKRLARYANDRNDREAKAKAAPVAEATSLKKHVRIVKGPAAGKTGYVGEVRRGQYKGAPKTFTIDIEGGGNIQCTKDELRLIKDVVGESPTYGGGNANWAVTYDMHGSNQDVRLATKTRKVQATSKEDAIAQIRKLVGGRNHKATQLGEALEREPQYADADFAKPMFERGASNDISDIDVGTMCNHSMIGTCKVKRVNPNGSVDVVSARDRKIYRVSIESLNVGEAATIDEANNPQDEITIDVPLLIRLLEYAREDAKTDMDLHNVAEQLIKLSGQGCLSMAQYEQIVGGVKENARPNDKWGKDMPSFGYDPEEEKKDREFFKQAFAAPKEKDQRYAGRRDVPGFTEGQ